MDNGYIDLAERDNGTIVLRIHREGNDNVIPPLEIVLKYKQAWELRRALTHIMRRPKPVICCLR